MASQTPEFNSLAVSPPGNEPRYLKSPISSMLNDSTANLPQDLSRDSRKNTRRSVACKNCHGLKVKCVPSDENDPASPCIRCVNSQRKCEINLNQPRKRRKKAEILEERARKQAQSQHHPKDSKDADPQLNPYKYAYNNLPSPSLNIPLDDRQVPGQSIPPLTNLPPPPIATPAAANDQETINKLQKQIELLKTEVGYYKQRAQHIINPPQYVSKTDLENELKILSKNSASGFMQVSNHLKQSASIRAGLIWNKDDTVDVVGKGIITIEQAEVRLLLYKEVIYPKFPYIDVDNNLTIEQVIQKEPYFFNAVMAVTNVCVKDADETTCHRIEIEATSNLMLQVFLAGNKTEELLKSIMLLGFWYNTPELVRQRRYHLLNVLGISLLHDLGIVAKGPSSDSLIDDNLTSDQQRKIVMLLYTTTVSTCLILRRSIYVKWTPYVEECCQFLEQSSDPRLTNLALFSRLSNILEKIHNLTHAPDSNFDNSSATTFIIREFQKQLLLIKSKISEDEHAILAYYYSVEAYLHEPLVNQFTGVNSNGELSFKEEAIGCISRSTVACLKSLEEFSKLGPESVATVPLVYISRMIYTAGILLRLRYLILSIPFHIEKGLVPADAIVTVQNTNLLFIKAGKLYPYNFFLKKTSLMLQLFIQTYANQVQNLLDSGDGTPSNLKEHDEVLDQYFLGNSRTNAVMTTDSGVIKHQNVPLDILSYAASLKNELSKVHNHMRGDRSKPASPSSVSSSNSNPRLQGLNQPQQPLPNIDSRPSPLHQDFSQNVAMQDTPNNLSSTSMSPNSGQNTGSVSFFGIPGFEELDKSFYNIGEEFWSDIVNPDSNNFNLEGKPNIASDVFFMNA